MVVAIQRRDTPVILGILTFGALLFVAINLVTDLVYALVGDDLWEPRRVTVGQDFGERVQIVAGVTKTDAVSGASPQAPLTQRQ